MKRGFTLIELLVYMGLIGVIVVIAGQAFSDSTKFRVRTENMLQGTTEADNLSQMIAEDLSQMGAKFVLNDGSNKLETDVFYDDANSDHSSFALNASKNEISFKKLVYDKNGVAEYSQLIKWRLDGKTLYRSCQSLEIKSTSISSYPPDCPHKDEGEPFEVLISDKVEEFSLTPGRRLQDADFKTDAASYYPSKGYFAMGNNFALAPRVGAGFMRIESVASGSNVALSQFSSNTGSEKVASQLYLLDGNPTGGDFDWKKCVKFSFEPYKTYAIAFQLVAFASNANPNFMRDFLPGTDHISIGLRKPDGNVIPYAPDFMVYPSESNDDYNRYVEFSVPQRTDDVCLAFTIALFSPLVWKGSLTVSKFAVTLRDEAEYSFVDFNLNDKEEKKKVKAFNLDLALKYGKETSRIKKMIPTPDNGTEE